MIRNYQEQAETFSNSINKLFLVPEMCQDAREVLILERRRMEKFCQLIYFNWIDKRDEEQKSFKSLI